jgi:hypothetical protein
MEAAFMLGIYVPLIPLIIAYVVGITLAIITWPRHPRVGLFVLLACLLGLFNVVAMTWVNTYFPIRLREEHGWSNADMGKFYTVLAFVRSALSTLTIVFLVVAAVGWRSAPAPVPVRPDDYPPQPPR